MNKLCVLNIGHSKKSPGAKSSGGITEFELNDYLSRLIEKLVKNVKIERVYQRTLKTLPDTINALGPHFAFCMHCNAYDGNVSGTEVLYYHESRTGKLMAEILQRHLVSFLGLRDRGIIPIKKYNRGGKLLYHLRAPGLIAEPFFIDNPNDLARALNDMDGLARAYATAIDEIALLF